MRPVTLLPILALLAACVTTGGGGDFQPPAGASADVFQADMAACHSEAEAGPDDQSLRDALYNQCMSDKGYAQGGAYSVSRGPVDWQTRDEPAY